MEIPQNWTQPKYSLGQRTKQGLIIGIDYYPENTRAAHEYGNTWSYLVIKSPWDNPDDLLHYEESEIEPLSAQELRVKIQQEFEFHARQLEFLEREMSCTECTASLMDESVLVSCGSDDIIGLIKGQRKLIAFLTRNCRIERITLVADDGRRTNFYPKNH